MGLQGRVFTLDTEHCQKTFEVARATGNPLIVQVKGSPSKLLKQVKALAREASALGTQHPRAKLAVRAGPGRLSTRRA
jgi:hypothetical protein